MDYFSRLWIRLTGSLKSVALPALVLIAVVYGLYHGVTGQNGLRAYLARGSELAALGAEASALEQRRLQLENRKALLDAARLDPDMVDELARRSLGFMAPGEQMLQMPLTGSPAE